jgi:hypothetical protein
MSLTSVSVVWVSFRNSGSDVWVSSWWLGVRGRRVGGKDRGETWGRWDLCD